MQGPLHPVNGIGVLHQIAARFGVGSLLTVTHEIFHRDMNHAIQTNRIL